MPYAAAIWPSGPYATLVTYAALTSIGESQRLAPGVEQRRAAGAASRGDPALGPNATLTTRPGLTFSGGVGRLAPGVEQYDTVGISRGDLRPLAQTPRW